MKTLRAIAGILLCGLLGGCGSWEGKPFFAASESRPPFMPGFYKFTAPDSPGELARWTGDHFESKSDKGRPDGLTAVFLPLGASHSNSYVVQLASDRDDAWYWIGRGDADRFVMAAPICKQTETMVLGAGGTVIPYDPPVEAVSGDKKCVFPDRESLLAAARRYVTERQLVGMLVERVGAKR